MVVNFEQTWRQACYSVFQQFSDSKLQVASCTRSIGEAWIEQACKLNKLNNLSDSNNSSGWVLVTNRVTGWAKNKVCSTNRQANGASKRLNNLTTHFIFTSHLTARHVNLPLVSIQSVWTTEWFECFGRNDSKGMVRHRADELLASTGWLMFRNATECNGIPPIKRVERSLWCSWWVYRIDRMSLVK